MDIVEAVVLIVVSFALPLMAAIVYKILKD